MEYRQLGKSGLKVSALTMGAMTFGGRGVMASIGNVGVDDARRLTDMCLDAGVNLIDTADVYSAGLSEEIVGEVLGGKRKNNVMIATKARFRMGDGPNDSGLSRFHLIQACEASLKRLRTDVIDLYQLHQWDGQTPLEETMEALDTLIRQGKIRYIGCSNFSAWHIMKAMGVAERRGYQPFVSQQIYYSVDGRDAEFELVPVSIDQGIGILVWSPLAGGLLTGKHRRDHTVEGTRRAVGGFGAPIQDEDRTWKIVDTIIDVAKARGVTGSQVALAWLLERPGVTSLIIGGRNEAQFKDNLAAAEFKLSTEEIERLEKVGRPFLLYPYWHQLRAASDRMSAADATLLRPRL